MPLGIWPCTPYGMVLVVCEARLTNLKAFRPTRACRRRRKSEPKKSEPKDAPWNTGLAEGGTPILHRLFAIDSHPQWGGGMTLRCSVRSCRPGERACHSRTSHAFEQPAMDAALSLIADMMQEMREGAMDAS